jgi:hypothetical protein
MPKEALVNEVPRNVESMFREMKEYAPEDSVEGEGGLRWQYTHGIIDENRVSEIVQKHKVLKELIDKKIWVP